MSDSYIEIELNSQPIELYKLLKIANLVSGGGEAKVVISEGYVLLNGEVEYQKRKKVYHEDVIQFNDELIQLIVNEVPSEILDEAAPQLDSETVKKKDSQPKTNKSGDTKKVKTGKKNPKSKKSDFMTVEADSEYVIPPRKRRPISF